jgi:tape measure domain-containing protein
MATKDVELRIRARDKASKQLSDIQKAIDSFSRAQAQAGEASQKSGGLLSAFGQEIGKVATDLAKLRGLQNFTQDLQKVDSSLSAVSSELKETRDTSKLYEDSLKNINRDLSKYEKELTRVSGALDKQNAANALSKARLSDVSVEARKAQSELTKLERALNAASPKRRPSVAKVEGQRVRSGSLSNARSALTENLQQGEAASRKLKQAQKELQQEVTRLTAEQAKYSRDVSKTAQAIEKQLTSVVALKNQKRELQSEIDRTNRALRTELTTLDQIEAAQQRAVQTGNRLRQAIATAPRRTQEPSSPAADSTERLQKLQEQYRQASQAAKQFAAAIGLTRSPTQQQQQDLQRSASELARLRGEILQIRTQPFKDLAVSIRETRAQIAQNNATIRQLGPAVREGGLAATEAKTRILELVAENQRLSGTLTQQKAQYESLRPSIRQVINEFKQSDIEVRKTNTALLLARQGFTSLLGSIRPTTVSLRTFTGAATGAAAALLQLNSGTAPLGSVFRSLRGSVTATAASFLSFFAIFRQTQEIIASFQQLEAAQNRLQVVFNGDQTATSKELRILQAESKRLGVEFGVLADEYSKFTVAATQANISLGTARDLFIAVTEAGRVNKLSNEQLGGTFLALTQIISKGKFQAEEITRQLGDRLPGAISLFAKALTDGDIPKFFDELQKGNLRPTEENLQRLANTFRETFGGQLQGSLDSTTTQLSRFAGLITIARQRIGQAGFIDAFTASLRDLNQFLDSRRGEEFFRAIGQGLTSLVQAARFLVENIDLLASAFRAFIAVKIVSFLAGIGLAFKKNTVDILANNAALGLALVQSRALAASASASLVPALLSVSTALRTLNFASVSASLTGLVSVIRSGFVPSLILASKVLLNLGRAAFAALGPIGLFIGAFEVIGGLFFDVSIFDVFGSFSGGLDDATESALETSFALQRIADAAVKSGRDVDLFRQTITEDISLAQAQQEFERLSLSVETAEKSFIDFEKTQVEYSTALGPVQQSIVGIVQAFSRKQISYKEAARALNALLAEQLANRNISKEQASAISEVIVEFDKLGKKLDEDRATLSEYSDLLAAIGTDADQASAALDRLANRQAQRQEVVQPGLDSKEIQEEIIDLQKSFQADLLKTQELQASLARVEELRKLALDDQGNILKGQEDTYSTLVSLVNAITQAIDEQSAAFKTIQDQTKTLEELEIEKSTLLIKNNKQRAIELATQLAINRAVRDGITEVEQLQSIRDNAAKIAAAQFDIREGSRPARTSGRGRTGETEEQKQAKKQQKFNEDLAREEIERAESLRIIQIEDAQLRAVQEARQEALNRAARQGVSISEAQLNVIERQAAARFNLLNPQREFEASQKRVTQLQRILDQNERRIQTLRQRGDSASLAAAEKLEITQIKTRDLLSQNIEKAIELARTTIKDPLERDAVVGALEGQLESLKVVIGGISGEEINNIFTQNATSGFDTFFEKLKEGEGVLRSLGEAFKNFVSQTLQQISRLILNQAFTALFGGIGVDGGLNSGGGFSGGIAGAISGLFFHDGGTVGSGGTPGQVPAATFLAAKRFHGGGLPGLKKDEVPAILQTGEEVLSRSDPRNVMNGGGQSGMQNIKVVNTIDSGSFISEGLNTSEGQKAIVNYIRANKATVRNILGV